MGSQTSWQEKCMKKLHQVLTFLLLDLYLSAFVEHLFQVWLLLGIYQHFL